MKARNGVKIGEEKVLTAHRDFSDFCCKCFKDIFKNQLYVRRTDGLYHYYCTKSRTK